MISLVVAAVLLLIHALEVESAQQVIDHIKQHYERPLMEIFE